MVTARFVGLRRHQRTDPARPADRRPHPPGARPARTKRLHLCPGSHHGRGAVGRSVCAHHLDARHRSEERAAAREPAQEIVTRDICLAAPGAKDWQPSAWSPRTGLLYVPANNLCMDHEGTEANYIEGTPFVGANVRMYAGPGGHRGELFAWDPVARRKVWSLTEKYPVW